MKPKPSSLRHTPAKGTLSILVILQMLIAVILFLENSLNLTRNAEHFDSEETRIVVFVAWLLVLLWLLTILVSLIALFTNSYNLLLPHLVWTGFLCAVCTVCSLTLFFSDTRPWTMFLSSGIAVLLGISVIVEAKCFLAMRQCLR
ncbi:hypothetical protein GCK32_019230 [Trichostrongylus colubriformis]|uniref:Uncharacterized protein n=1 Tax=Trichostrongylus colubriformis TaxID=6319 RepID=A0AAN8FQ92_TRICO